MIKIINNYFILSGEDFSYVISVDKFNHLATSYIGHRLLDGEEVTALSYRESFPPGSSVVYDESVDPDYSYDQRPLEVATLGKGDYREPSIILRKNNEELFDFKYVDYQLKEKLSMEVKLPTPHDVNDVLILRLRDERNKVSLYLQYGVTETAIVRNVKLVNESEDDLTVIKLLSLNLDIPNQNYTLYAPYGSWASEFNIAAKPLTPGIYVHEAKTGSSSAKHNPFTLLLKNGLSSTSGPSFGFNFIYSGSHYTAYELSTFDNIRIQIGLNPSDFHPVIKPNEQIETPFAVLTYSNNGQNGVSQNLHQFTTDHILRHEHAKAMRPIVVNNWEATYFKFNEKKLHQIIDNASDLGIELFVLDDGWFGRRNDDTGGLGDWTLNPKKLPKGLGALSDYAGKKGLKFGLWFEPEMISYDSKLYENHPEWMLHVEGVKPSSGRHQYILDLSLTEVQDYLIKSLSDVLASAPINYVKWDFNRVFSDVGSIKTPTNRLLYDYYLGLYRVLDEITKAFPAILYENCASGGGRFDLGMLSYFDQTWTSDNSDAGARLIIQSGAALAYPLVTISNHVSAVPSHQMLRSTPLHTRFNVAAFGVLGYELDLDDFNPLEKKWSKAHIEYYKKHRELLQFGKFYQLANPSTADHYLWCVVSENQDEALVGYYQVINSLIKGQDRIKTVGLIDDALYEVEVLRQDHEIKMFGGLVKMVLPPGIEADGKIVTALNKRQSVESLMKIGSNEKYLVSGKALNDGALLLNPQWRGTGINQTTRILGDFGSTLIYIRRHDA